MMRQRTAPLSARMQQCLAEHLPEFAVQQFHKHVLSGKSTTPTEERLALESLQRFETSQWAQSRRLLRLIAADKGLDPETGEYVSSSASRRSLDVVAEAASDSPRPSALRFSPSSPTTKHPAWGVQVREQTQEELHEIRIKRCLQVLRGGAHLWSPGRAAAVVKSFALSELQRLVNDAHLRQRVLPWPMASLMELLTPASTLLSSPVTPTLEQLQLCRDRTVLGESSLMDALCELDRRTPSLTSSSALPYLNNVCPNIDEVFLSSLARSLHFRCVVRCAADGDQSFPPFLLRDRMSNVFPRLHALSRIDPMARAAHIARRTVRADVSHGVLVPDADFIATQFDRLTSLSQHREVLVCFSVLVKLVRLASPDSDDWRRFQLQRNLWQLLNSITTDCHANHSAQQRGATPQQRTESDDGDHKLVNNYGGVTFLGLLDELAIREYMAEHRNGGAWGSSNASGAAKDDDQQDVVACCAKYVERWRDPSTLNEQHDSAGGGPSSAVRQSALAAILQDFGVGRKPNRDKVHLGNVVVLSRDAEIQRSAFKLGVKVQA